MSHRYDVAIVGAGTAGLAALREVRKATDNFILVNDGPYGTTCARVGCMPSKALIEAANAYHRRTAFGAFGIDGADSLSVDLRRVFARVRRLRDDFVGGALRATDDLGERSIAGRARFEDAQTLLVGERRLRADKIILATGSRPVLPEPWKALGDRVLTSDGIFEQETLPPRMAVVGLGPIGVELGQALARLGIEITAFGKGEGLAAVSDPAVRETALAAFQSEFTIHLGEAAKLEPAGDGLRVIAGDTVVVVDKVLAAMGRRPNLDGLGLERLGIALTERGLPPFDPQTLQIADLPVFIAGDLNGRMPVLHEAADDGYIAGRNAVAATPDCYLRRTPLAIVFTDPNIAAVGRPFADLAHGEFVIGEVSFARHGRARTAETNRGVLRVYADKRTGRLLGAELCAPAGEHMAHLLALAIQQNLTLADMLRMPVYHPVMEEGLRAALRRAGKQLHQPPSSDLAHCHDFGIEALD
jgi:dihydrolipoamide dehydrogenase